MSFLKGMRGFTLIELMITVVLLTIVATVAVPNFTRFIQNNQVQAKADELKSLLQYARGQAVTRRKAYEIVFSKTGVKVSSSDRGVERTLGLNDTKVEANIVSPVGLSVVQYTLKGTSLNNVEITVCSGDDFSNGYLIQIRKTGGVKMYKRGYKSNNELLTSC